MNENNVVLLRGTIASDPVRRELRSGDVVTHVELTTRVDGRAVSVPVAVHHDEPTVGAGDEVVVTGHVRRRFFRAGGVTQSRTEVIASRMVRASRRRAAQRAIDRVLEVAERSRVANGGDLGPDAT